MAPLAAACGAAGGTRTLAGCGGMGGRGAGAASLPGAALEDSLCPRLWTISPSGWGEGEGRGGTGAGGGEGAEGATARLRVCCGADHDGLAGATAARSLTPGGRW